MVPVSVLWKFFYASVNFKLSRYQLRGLFLVAHLLSYFFGYFFAMPWQYMNCISAFVKTRPIPYHPRCAECALRLITASRLNNSSHYYLSHVLRKGGLMYFQKNIYTGQPSQADETKLNSICNLVSTSTSQRMPLTLIWSETARSK